MQPINHATISESDVVRPTLVEVDLAQLGPKESFGEMALLTGQPRSAYVEALEETHLTVPGLTLP